MRTILLYLFLFIYSFGYSQNADCIDPLVLTDKCTIYIESTDGEGEVEDNYENLCYELGAFDLEYSSLWLKFTAYTSGSFYFTATPDELDDLDFFVFGSPSGSCEDLESLRCSASGCDGPVGLDPEDPDIFEDPNCDDGENNFANAIELYEGDTYFILINNFTNSKAGYTLEFYGDAELGPDDPCSPSSIFETSVSQNQHVYPNPSPGQFYLKDLGYNGPVEIRVYNMSGKQISNLDLGQERSFDLDLVSGMYVMQIFEDSQLLTNEKVIIE